MDSGAFNHHSADGANLRTSHKGIALAISQKNGAMEATITNPSSRSIESHL